MAFRFLTPLSRIRQRASRHPHFALIAVVFLTFRLLSPLVFRNGSFFTDQAPDLGDFLRWGTLADSGLYPYLDYSWDYPPLFPWSTIALYRLSALLPPGDDQRLWFSVMMQTAMALADTGSLTLVYAIARRMGSQGRAIRATALFAGSFIMAYAASGWYESVPVCLMLLALYLSLRNRTGWALTTIGLGFVTKIVPIVIAPVVLRRVVGLRRRAAYVVLLAAVILTLLLPFLLVGTDHLLAFVQVTMNRPTWLSLWAVLDGNYQYGATLPIADRFSPENIGVPDASALPWPIIHLVFLAVFLFVVTRRIDWQAPSVSVTFAGLMVNLVLLWSKGFSGQFIANAVPFIVLLAPNLRGAFYTGLLSILWVAEWPIAFLAVDGSAWFITWLVIVRTATLLALSLEHASGMIRNSAQPSPRLASRLTRVSTGILIAGWLTVLPAGIAAVNVYTQTRLDTDPATPALALIQATSGSANRTIVFAVPRLFRRLYPLAHVAGEVWLLPSDRHVPEPHRVTWLNGLAARGPFWFVADEGDPGTHQENLDAEAWVSNQACKVDTQIAGSTRVSRFVSIGDAPIHGSLSAVFADEIELTGYRMSGDALRPGSGWCIELAWRALAAPAGDYTVFVHLVDAQGRVVAQNDMSPQGGFAPTGAWSVGVSLADQHGILLPNDLSAGEYTVQVGLYRSDDQSPVRVTRGERLMPDARGILLAIAHVAP